MLGDTKSTSNRGDIGYKRKVHDYYLPIMTALILCVLFAGAIALTVSDAEEITFNDGKYTYAVTSQEDRTVTLTGLYDESLTEITIPDTVTHDGITYVVTAVGDHAFQLYEITGTLNIPANVKTIGYRAFEGIKITSLAFASDSKLETISKYAFNGCSEIKGTIEIPSCVKLIDDTAFNLCGGFESLVFKDSTLDLEIGSSAFSNCKSLKTLAIPNRVTSISDSAFKGCTGLETLTFVSGSKLGTIGEFAFADCTGLGDISFPKSLTLLDRYSFYKSSVTGISFETGSQLKTIDYYAFNSCEKLAGSIAFPSSLEKIGTGAFQGTDITSITFTEPTGDAADLTIEDRAFSGCKSLNCQLVLPSNLSTLGDSSFEGTSIAGVVFNGNGPETVGPWCFANCEKLAGNLKIMAGTKTISEYAFYKTKIASLDLNDATSLEKIEKSSFFLIDTLHITSLTIPSSVYSIGDSAFAEAKIDKLKFAIDSKLDIVGSFAFANCGIGGELLIPSSLEFIGAMAFSDNGFTELIIDYDSKLIQIMDNAFSGCSMVENTVIFIPKGLVNIGSQCFSGMGKNVFVVDELNTVYSSNAKGWLVSKDGTTVVCCLDCDDALKLEGIKKIEDGAFSGLSITSLVLGEGLESMGTFAFAGCSELGGNVDFPSSLKSIGSKAFQGTNITSISFAHDSHLSTIGAGAFSGCDTITGDIVIPASVESIGGEAFSTTAICSLSFEDGSKLLSIGKAAFKYCKNLVAVTVPANVIVINEEAFSRCTNLSSVTFEGDKIEAIESQAFSACNNLSYVKFGQLNNLASVGESVFTHNGTHAGPTMFKESVADIPMEFTLDNKSKFAGNLFTKDSGEMSDPLCRSYVVTVDFRIEWIENYEIYVPVGKVMERPELIESEHYVCTGWYVGNTLWTFDKVITGDMTMEPRFAIIDDNGHAVVDGSPCIVEIDFTNESLLSARIQFGSGLFIDIDKGTCNDIIRISMVSKVRDRYETTIDETYHGIVTITLPCDYSRGFPEVYHYDGTTKEKMESSIDYIDGTVTFWTEHSSTFGVEYRQWDDDSAGTGNNAVAIIFGMAIAVIIAVIGVCFYMRRQ